MSKHDDVEYEVKTKVDGKPLNMQVFTSPKPEVREKHIKRIVSDHNARNGEGTMELLSFEPKTPTIEEDVETTTAALTTTAPAEPVKSVEPALEDVPANATPAATTDVVASDIADAPVKGE